MSNSPIKTLFNEFLKMPYFKNYAAASGSVHNFANHEEAISELMVKHGYSRFIPSVKLQKKKF